MSVEFRDNSHAVLAAMARGKKKALTAIGLTAVEFTTGQMYTGYGRPIYQTGDLIRSIESNVRVADSAVDIGSELEYSAPVHEGSGRMVGRPFLRDAILPNGETWKEITVENIKEEMK